MTPDAMDPIPLTPVELTPEQVGKRETRIWRYIDPMKLISLLHHKALFFPRLDYLGDPHEGALGRPNAKELIDSLAHKDEEQRKALVAAYNATRAQRFLSVAVSCWHASRDESAAMWNIYGPRGMGLAIQSTIGHVEDSYICLSDREVQCDFVKYVDYETTHIDPAEPGAAVLFKRGEFRYENEVRFYMRLTEQDKLHIDIYKSFTDAKKMTISNKLDGTFELVNMTDSTLPRGVLAGIMLPVHVQHLVRAIYVAPNSPLVHLELLRILLKKYQVDVPVYLTSMDRPIYDSLAM